MSDSYHRPVLLHACIEGLGIRPTGIYVDATFGGGGHSKEILSQLTTGRLIAFDQDLEAGQNVIPDQRFTLLQQNFRFLKNNLRVLKVLSVNGIMADLGVSSHQFNVPERGFSIRHDAELDMRMNPASSLTAMEVVNGYKPEKLRELFRDYGEVMNARQLANSISLNRPIRTIAQLRGAISDCIPKRKENQYLAKVFQALRIEVNDELGALKDLLEQSVEVLATGGRLVVLSYHSLEDRLVKNFIKAGNFTGEVEKDFYGNPIKPLQAVNRKVITPSIEEVKQNNRARSAKLRIAQRT